MTTKSVSGRMSNAQRQPNRHMACFTQLLKFVARSHRQTDTLCTNHAAAHLYGKPHAIINLGDEMPKIDFRVFDTVNECEVTDHIDVKELRRHNRDASPRRAVITRGEGKMETNIGFILEDGEFEPQPGYVFERKSKPGIHSMMASDPAPNAPDGTLPPAETE